MRINISQIAKNSIFRTRNTFNLNNKKFYFQFIKNFSIYLILANPHKISPFLIYLLAECNNF